MNGDSLGPNTHSAVRHSKIARKADAVDRQMRYPNSTIRWKYAPGMVMS